MSARVLSGDSARFRMNPARLRIVQVLVVIASLIPFLRLFVLGYANELGANPVEAVTRLTGWWTLTMLCITLCVTPLRRITGAGWLLRLRRTLGLMTFFYACAHLTTWVWFEHWFDLLRMARDIRKHLYITAGVAAFLLMLPLALTSTQRAMRRLGRHWQRLHRAIYLIAPLGVLHFWWHKAAKNDIGEPLIFLIIVATLLVWRLVVHLKSR